MWPLALMSLGPGTTRSTGFLWSRVILVFPSIDMEQRYDRHSNECAHAKRDRRNDEPLAPAGKIASQDHDDRSQRNNDGHRRRKAKDPDAPLGGRKSVGCGHSLS